MPLKGLDDLDPEREGSSGLLPREIWTSGFGIGSGLPTKLGDSDAGIFGQRAPFGDETLSAAKRDRPSFAGGVVVRDESCRPENFLSLVARSQPPY
ncbi:unnamed protein product [Coffea canephora]|uniref:DH200=94 genomic scaffold, scaffold_438 n=1 Tax=Coffea canephora TaxID=49390 RepID=A0A068VET0_COFCA|nr:unnamed protein product [Coffea canephora]